MAEVTTIGVDLAKKVFPVHGVDASGVVRLRRAVRRRQVLAFFAKLPPCLCQIAALSGGGVCDSGLLGRRDCQARP